MKYFYVICPVATDPAFSSKAAVLQESGGAFDLVPFFPLDRRASFDLGQALQDMLGAQFVFADLSYERPSCYYEFGLAQGLGLKCLTVAAIGTPVHQLSRPEEVRFFRDLKEYKSEVLNALRTETPMHALTSNSPLSGSRQGHYSQPG